MQVRYLFKSRNLFFLHLRGKSARIAGIITVVVVVVVAEKTSIHQNTTLRQQSSCV